MEFCGTIEKYGYKYTYKVLNSKDFGVPQNRERVFPIFYRDPDWQFEYPKPFPLEKRLRDVLEENVPEEYYLRPEQVERILAHCERKQAEGCGFKPNFQDVRSVDASKPLVLTFTDKYDQWDMTFRSDGYRLLLSRPCTVREFVKAFIEQCPGWNEFYGLSIGDMNFDKEPDETYADLTIFDSECKAINGYGWRIYGLHPQLLSGGGMRNDNGKLFSTRN